MAAEENVSHPHRDERALPESLSGPLQEMAQAFLALEHATAFYPEGHQARLPNLSRLHTCFHNLLGKRSQIVIGCTPENLYWEGTFYGLLSPALKRMVAGLHRRGIAHLKILEGLTTEEVQLFMEQVVSSGHGAPPPGYWGGLEKFLHLEVDEIDYKRVLTGEAAHGDHQEGSQQRLLWSALLGRIATDTGYEVAPDEVRFLEGLWEQPEEMAALFLDSLGANRGEVEGGQAVESIASIIAALEKTTSGKGGSGRKDHGARLREVGTYFPSALRFHLLEAALAGEREGCFNEAFGRPSPRDLVDLLASNFTLESAHYESPD